MTPQEAIEMLKQWSGLASSDFEFTEKGIECFLMAIQALENQVPKKPIYKHYEEKGEKPYIKTVCPNGCHFRLNVRYDKYCPNCGQRIDWEESEEE